MLRHNRSRATSVLQAFFCSDSSLLIRHSAPKQVCGGFQVLGILRLGRGTAAMACVALVIVLAFAASCNRNKTAASDSILVGVVLSTTGREAKPGQYQKEGIELAIKQINQN